MSTRKIELFSKSGSSLGTSAMPYENLGSAVRWSGRTFVMNPAAFAAAVIPYHEIEVYLLRHIEEAAVNGI